LNCDSKQESALKSILAQATSKSLMRDGNVDVSLLMQNLCGNYTVNGKEVKKY
jgi:hypothetical protein